MQYAGLNQAFGMVTNLGYPLFYTPSFFLLLGISPLLDIHSNFLSTDDGRLAYLCAELIKFPTLPPK